MDVDQVSFHPVMTRRHWGGSRWTLVVLVLLGWTLRLPPILNNRFHADEALYGYWGLLIGRGHDPWLASVPVYKPPLLPYLVAGAQALFGDSEFAVRFCGLVAGLLMVPLVAALARSLYRERWTATMAAVGIALSPFAILFSATAFTDPVMVTLGLAACVAAARGRPGWAGVLAGLSCATKQTGLAWLPLASIIQISKSKNPRSLLPTMGQWSLVIGLTFAWDAMRVTQGAESFWNLGVSGYGGLRLIWPHELWIRLRGWLGLAHYFFSSSILSGAMLIGLPVLVWNSITHRRDAQESLADLVLASFSLVYFLFHWLWAFPVWDRYLLPLVPIMAILLSRIINLLISCTQRTVPNSKLETQNSQLAIRNSLLANHSLLLANFSLLLANRNLLLAILLVLSAWNAAQSRYPVGGDHWAYDGIDQATAFLCDLSEGTVVYQHWLGWHYAYHLFDAPVYLAYWPTPAWLAQDVQAFGAREPRYVTFPSWESPSRTEQALADVGYQLNPVLTTTRRDNTRSFTVYHIQPLADQ
ncbi:MAG: phospholipid carrier-dependent glycosyltransferase [Chloroflexi bacterium]|nr:phospholipid carrier-dependent glycosyltransferase [Chloroflexota bacterium]